MIKKYQEFLEAKKKMLDQWVLSLSINDLNADYEFHKNIFKYFEKEDCDTKNGIKGNESIGHFTLLKNETKLYIINILEKNKLNCEYYSFYTCDEKADPSYKNDKILFNGKKSDLIEINKYYGIDNDKNIIHIFIFEDYDLYDCEKYSNK